MDRMEARVDRFGRILIPKKLRRALALEAGTVLRIEEREGAIALRPVAERADLVRERGVLVFRGAAAGDLTAAVDRERAERAEALGMRPRRR